MSDPAPDGPVVHTDGQAHSRLLMPLWGWLASFSVLISLVFVVVVFAIKIGAFTDGSFYDAKVDMWGVLVLAPCLCALYGLTLIWMQRNYQEKPKAGSWERLPAPAFWQLPVSDSVTHRLRLMIWLLVFVLPVIILAYLAKIQFQADFPRISVWLCLALVTIVFWCWLRIMLSVLFRRMILESVWTTLRRISRWRLWRRQLASITPPTALPQPMLRVGVIGHRDLAARELHVKEQLVKALQCCRRSGYGLRLISGMAAGTDRLAVNAALEQLTAENDRKDLELLVLLPSDSDSFRDHSSVEDPPAFSDQLAQVRGLATTGRVAVLELPGVMNRHSDPRLRDRSQSKAQWDVIQAEVEQADAGHRALRIAAHRYKTDVLLRQCEFLIAIMKLSDTGKPGGTRECVEEALALNTPVLVIDVDSEQIALVTRVDQLRAGGLPTDDGLEAFARIIAGEDLLAVDALGMPTQLDYLRRIYKVGEVPRTNLLAIWWTYFKAWFFNEQGPEPSVDLLEKAKEQEKAKLEKIQAEAAQSTTPVPAPYFLAALRRRIADDQNAIMTGYRGAFVLAYGLGLVAVTLALGIVLLLVIPPVLKPSMLLVIGLLTLLKLAVVVTISWIIHATGPHAKAHAATTQTNRTRSAAPTVADTAVALRYVAERLRIMPTMGRLGGARMDLLHQTHRMGEPARVAEDLCRRMPLAEVIAQFDHSTRGTAALDELSALQQSQLDYNTKSNIEWQRTHDRLEAIVNGASKWIIRVILLDLLVLTLKLGLKLKWIAPFTGEHLLTPLGLILVLATALLPAIMATCNALIFQSQCEQLAERERELATTFQEHLTRTKALQSQIENNLVGTPVAAAILIEAERSAAVLAEEVAEWAVMSKQKAKEA